MDTGKTVAVEEQLNGIDVEYFDFVYINIPSRD
jgi:hypothetical protein